MDLLTCEFCGLVYDLNFAKTETEAHASKDGEHSVEDTYLCCQVCEGRTIFKQTKIQED